MAEDEDKYEVRMGQKIFVCPHCLRPIGLGPMQSFTKEIGKTGCEKCNWTGYQIGGPSRDPIEAARGERVAYPCPDCSKAAKYKKEPT